GEKLFWEMEKAGVDWVDYLPGYINIAQPRSIELSAAEMVCLSLIDGIELQNNDPPECANLQTRLVRINDGMAALVTAPNQEGTGNKIIRDEAGGPLLVATLRKHPDADVRRYYENLQTYHLPRAERKKDPTGINWDEMRAMTCEVLEFLALEQRGETLAVHD